MDITEQWELVARTARSDLIGVRCTKWKECKEELQDVKDNLENRGVETEFIEKRGQYALYKAMEREVAERIGWI